jgi:hypothetical protein
MNETKLYRANLKAAKRWAALTSGDLRLLRDLTRSHSLAVAGGELSWIDGHWYVTHAGLLGIARRNHCSGIHARPAADFCDASAGRWAFKAIVYKSPTCRGFVGYGDADPSNVSPRMHGAEMRIAETRAVNRALRKAYGIGICSVEELGASVEPPPSPAVAQRRPQPLLQIKPNGHALRDRLRVIIRQHRLDPDLVKAYAADYCDVAELKQATREQVEQFVQHLAEYARASRDELLCQLNSYGAKPQPAAPSAETHEPLPKLEGAA